MTTLFRNGHKPTSKRMLLGSIIMLGVSLCLIIVLMMFISLTNLSSIRHILDSQELALVESCQRLNILRASDNESHYADWKVFTLVYHETLASPIPPNQTSQQKRFRLEFLWQIKHSSDVKAWTPLTDCQRAVNEHGAAYRPAGPIPFARQLPPANQLTSPSLHK